MHKKNDLKEMGVEQLRSIAAGLEIKGFKKMEQEELVYAILDHEAVVAGRFREPHITIAYTNKVMDRYENYCKIVE